MTSLAQKLTNSLEVTAGCTEPAAIAFCASFVGKYLEEAPQEIILRIDQRTYKNAFGAGIPRAGKLRGSEWALLFGFTMACPEKRLSIFSGLKEDAIAATRLLHDKNILTVELVEIDSLLIEVSAKGEKRQAAALIEGGHTKVTSVSANGETIDIAEDDSKQAEPDTFSFGKSILRFKKLVGHDRRVLPGPDPSDHHSSGHCLQYGSSPSRSEVYQGRKRCGLPGYGCNLRQNEWRSHPGYELRRFW